MCDFERTTQDSTELTGPTQDPTRLTDLQTPHQLVTETNSALVEFALHAGCRRFHITGDHGPHFYRGLSALGLEQLILGQWGRVLERTSRAPRVQGLREAE
jgi:hypothetical protein